MKLFPFLKIADEGLLKYADYLCNVIAVRAEADLRGGRPSSYVELFTKLFEHIANVVDAQEPIIDTHYSPGKMLFLVQQLQKECDVRARRIAEAFKTEIHFQEKVGPSPYCQSAAPCANFRF